MTGTWEIVLATIPTPILTPEVQKLGVTVETHVARDTYAVWGGAVASDMLEWYRKEYGYEFQQRAASQKDGTDWDYLMAEASASPAGAKGVMFLPHMSAAGCPVVDTRSLGAFVGLSNFAQRGDMLRAIIEGLDYQVLDIVTALKNGLGIAPDRLVAVGGATRNPFWMQNKADITGLPIEVPEVEESRRLARLSSPVLELAYTRMSRMHLNASISRARPINQTRNSRPSMPGGIKFTNNFIRFSNRSIIRFTINSEPDQRRQRHERTETNCVRAE